MKKIVLLASLLAFAGVSAANGVLPTTTPTATAKVTTKATSNTKKSAKKTKKAKKAGAEVRSPFHR